MIKWKQTTDRLIKELGWLGGRTRKLDEDDVRAVVTTARKLWRKHKDNPEVVAITVLDRGGFVASSYKYKADADKVLVEVVRQDDSTWALQAMVDRTWTQKRSHGVGNTFIARVRREGQREGTIVESR